MPFAPSLDRFRFYNDDGSESASTAAAAQDTNITANTSSGNVKYHLRLGLQETGAVAGAPTDDYQLQVSKNGGAYADVTTASSNVKAFGSAYLTEGAALTTNRLTGGTGSFVPGLVSEDGLGDNQRFTASNKTEFVYTVELIATDLVNADTLDFRVLLNGATIASTLTPRATVQTATVLYPTPIENAQTFYAPTLTYGQTLEAPMVTNAQVFYDAILSPITLNPPLVTNSQTFHALSLSQGAIQLTAPMFTNENTFHPASLSDVNDRAFVRNRRIRRKVIDYGQPIWRNVGR